MNHNMCPRGQSSASASTLVPIMPTLAESSFSLAIDDWLPDEEAAKETMRGIYGSQLTNDGSKPKRKDGKVVNYGCNVSGCMLRIATDPLQQESWQPILRRGCPGLEKWKAEV